MARNEKRGGRISSGRDRGGLPKSEGKKEERADEMYNRISAQSPVVPDRPIQKYSDPIELERMMWTYINRDPEYSSGLKKEANENPELKKTFYYLQARQAVLPLLKGSESFQAWCDFANSLHNTTAHEGVPALQKALEEICTPEEIKIIQNPEAPYEIDETFSVRKKPDNIVSLVELNELLTKINLSLKTILKLRYPQLETSSTVRVDISQLAEITKEIEALENLKNEISGEEERGSYTIQPMFHSPEATAADLNTCRVMIKGLLRLCEQELYDLSNKKQSLDGPALLELLETVGNGKIELSYGQKERIHYFFRSA